MNAPSVCQQSGYKTITNDDISGENARFWGKDPPKQRILKSE
jgi:hypothetical protein